MSKIDYFSHQHVKLWRDVKTQSLIARFDFAVSPKDEMKSFAFIITPVKDQNTTLFKLAALPTKGYINKLGTIERVHTELVNIIEPDGKHGIEAVPEKHPLYDAESEGKWIIVTSGRDVKLFDMDELHTLCKTYAVPPQVHALCVKIMDLAKQGKLNAPTQATIKDIEFQSVGLLPETQSLAARGTTSLLQ